MNGHKMSLFSKQQEQQKGVPFFIWVVQLEWPKQEQQWKLGRHIYRREREGKSVETLDGIRHGIRLVNLCNSQLFPVDYYLCLLFFCFFSRVIGRVPRVCVQTEKYRTRRIHFLFSFLPAPFFLKWKRKEFVCVSVCRCIVVQSLRHRYSTCVENHGARSNGTGGRPSHLVRMYRFN